MFNIISLEKLHYSIFTHWLSGTHLLVRTGLAILRDSKIPLFHFSSLDQLSFSSDPDTTRVRWLGISILYFFLFIKRLCWPIKFVSFKQQENKSPLNGSNPCLRRIGLNICSEMSKQLIPQITSPQRRGYWIAGLNKLTVVFSRYLLYIGNEHRIRSSIVLSNCRLTFRQLE